MEENATSHTMHATGALSDTNMTQVINQLKVMDKFNGNPNTLYTFVNRIDYLLELYPSTDARQKSILFRLVERNITCEVMQSLDMNNLTTCDKFLLIT